MSSHAHQENKFGHISENKKLQNFLSILYDIMITKKKEKKRCCTDYISKILLSINDTAKPNEQLLLQC